MTLEAHIRSAFDEAMERASASVAPLERFARQLVAARARNTIERAPHREHIERLHLLRIAVKRLRYALELFEPALDGGSAKCHARALAVQDLLGEHHDLVVLSDRVEHAAKMLHDNKRKVLSAGLAKLAANLRAEQARAVARYSPEMLSC